jgi:hypothetical protein
VAFRLRLAADLAFSEQRQKTSFDEMNTVLPYMFICRFKRKKAIGEYLIFSFENPEI